MKKTVDLWLSRKKKPGPAQVAFYGGSFTCMEQGVQEMLLREVQTYIEDEVVDSIRCSTRPDCITEEICSFLYQYKVRTVELGVQSLNDSVLRNARRGHCAVHSEKATQLLRDEGFAVGVQLMPGLPGESSSSFLRTIAGVIRLRPDFTRIYPTLVVAGSGLEQLYRRGEYMPLSLAKAIAVTAESYRRLKAAGIDVIRMGLQPSAILEDSVIAGPYHPSFGELVRSRLWVKKIRHRLNFLNPGERLEIHVSHRNVSTVIGMNKYNIKRLDALGFSGRYKIVADKAIEEGSVKYVIC